MKSSASLCLFLRLLALASPPLATFAENVASPSAEDLRCPPPESLVVSREDRDRRLAWWREARFGMFVHWGVSSGLSGTWQGKAYGGYGEHIQRMARIPVPVYHREVAGAFNPVHFDADNWVRLAKQAGMGYFIITAKHHDGFAMYDSKVSDATIVKATPFARDPMIELRDACRRHGLKFGFYYSHAFDWGEADAPGNDWDYQNPGGDLLLNGAEWWLKDTAFLARARTYVDRKAIPQILELIRQYQPDILWFDTPHKLPVEENLRILAAVRAAGPDVVVNGRIVSGRYQNRGFADYRSTTDKPAEFPPQTGDWEAIPTTNESYGYNANDHAHKPVAHFIGLVVKAAARGGNTLLNVGPRGDGSIDPADRAIFEGIGAWWKVNGESVRGTVATPLPVQAWGESTRRGNRLYLHVFQRPSDARLAVGGLLSPITKAWLLADPERPLAVSGNRIELPATPADPVASVVVIELAEEPRTEPVRLLSDAVRADVLLAFDATLVGSLRAGPGKKNDSWVQNWKTPDDAVVWKVRAEKSMSFDLEIGYDAPAAQGERLAEGDAGKEKLQTRRGAGGRYAITIAGETFERDVRAGSQIREPLGRVTIPAGVHELRVQARSISGEELFRLRHLKLTP